MKKIISLLIILAMALSCAPKTLAVSEAPSISAQSCILIHSGGGEVLYEKNADARMLIASTTKIMTAIVVIENCNLSDVVTVKPEWCAVEGSSMYLKAGDTFTVEQLLLGMMLVSGNDAAAALAIYTAGSIDEFADLMNAKARSLGLDDTAYKNPHGLDEDGHYSTARDLARLTDYCMQNAEFAAVVSRKSAQIGEQTFVNHNKLLWNCEGCLGVKTGYTMSSGRSLVSCCERDGMRCICVTLGDADDWRDHMSLYDWAFDNYSYETVISKGLALSLPVVSGEETSVPIEPEREIKLFLPSSTEITYVVELPRFVFAGVESGTSAGKITAYVDGREAASAKLVYARTLQPALSPCCSPWERDVRLW